ncbi:hypothetical protein BC829DRAFT_415303 [Chytridium lagenaria]|nr:hypothetical protein BC829DRAFT_415303 [Chytridium lagenaria]
MSSKNFFAILGEDEEGVKVEQPKVAAAKKEEPAAVQQKKTSRGPRTDYPRRGGARNVVAGDALKESSGPLNAPLTDSQLHELKEGRPRGGRGAARSAAGRGGYRGREFDRHSSNPRHDGEKKDVAGKGSWGNPVTAEGEAAKDGETPAADKENVEGAEGEKAEEVAPEPEEKLKTLEEYLAEVAAAKPVAAAAVRKANEGSDDSQWKDAVVLAKAEVEEDYFSGNKSNKSGKKTTKEVKTKVALDIEQKFADEQPARGEGYRGGRGGARGGRGAPGGARGGERGSRPSTGRGGPNNRGGPKQGGFVNVADPNAFPSLGGK